MKSALVFVQNLAMFFLVLELWLVLGRLPCHFYWFFSAYVFHVTVIDFSRHIDPPDLSPYTSNTNTEILSYEIETVLRKLKNTAPDCDNLPAWLFKKCSVELADVVAKLLSKSYAVGKVYANWKLAVVTPVPKIAKPTSFSDFRPISVHLHPSYHVSQRKFWSISGSFPPFPQTLFEISLPFILLAVLLVP